MKGPYDLFMMVGSWHLQNYFTKISQLLSATEICRCTLVIRPWHYEQDFSFITGNVKSIHYGSEALYPV